MSLIFTGVRLTNFLCYRGEQQVDLGPGVYALTAELDGDPRRSNALGKSAFLWALRFVLTGDHPKRTEDEWITDGEPEGGVDVELSDGTFASRWRKRGEATRLKVVVREVIAGDQPEPTERELWNDEAQKVLDRLVGLSKDEQATTWWSEQGEPDAFVNGDPGDTTAAVVSWCGVAPVRKAAKLVADALADLLKKDAKQLALLEDARREEKEIAALLPADVEAWREPRRENLERLRRLKDADATEAQRERERQAIRDEAARHAALDEKRVLLEMVEPAPSAEELAQAMQALEGKRERYAVAQADLQQKQKLARGEFDGKCPVGGIECPAKAQLNADAVRGRELYAEAKRSLKVVEDEGTLARKKLDELRRREREKLDADARLETLRPELERLAPSAFAAKGLAPAKEDDHQVKVETPEDLYWKQAKELEDMAALEARHGAAARRIAQAEAERAKLEPEVVARREALQILGPSGAQRRLVEDFLGEVEDAVNEDSARSGIDLRVSFEWQRELKELASACATCGQPFPASAKVKRCEGCGAERGRKIEQKLRTHLTPDSGGMGALAGVGTRLAGLAWLKQRRGSSWSVVALDEPFAMVDAHHRMLAARHLVAMLGGHYGVEQAFVSAHDQALLASLPCRVVVHGGATGSSIEVLR